MSITNNVMKKISSQKIKMKSRWYFFLGSLALLISLIGVVFLSIFSISLITFSLKTHGPMGAIRYQEIISNFPWWALPTTFISLTISIFLLKKYDFSYKINFLTLGVFFIAAIILSGVLIDLLGLDNLWMKKGRMRRFYKQYGEGKMIDKNNNFIFN